jgi:DNA-binding MurR/RpiR family transcriptional regulator
MGRPETHRGVHAALEKVMEAELGGIAAIFQQTISADWQQACAILAGAGRVYVTGFQSVRGIAEDFVRRLSLARGDVIYFSPFDNMLAEWTGASDPMPHAASDSGKAAPSKARDISQSCLLLVDVVPYARESADLARLAQEQGRRCIVVSDEYCHWGREVADAVVYAPSRTGLFLESTVGIALALALLVDAVARAHPEESQERLRQWKAHTKRLKLF